MYNTQELDVTREELRGMAQYLDNLGVDAEYNEDTEEVILVVYDNIITFVQTASAMRDDESERFSQESVRREVEHSW